MKSELVTFPLFVALIFSASVAELQAYEVPVHARMTNEAFTRSVLGGDQFLTSLGIENIKDSFGSKYYDVFGDEVDAVIGSHGPTIRPCGLDDS